ncbi:uncharacterized protein LOC129773425 [Toxorhynchites rutilus septentrionalis]|uniref:uncharacterized protein LOC129773425 n=1 Tax=Toxorhynchites rutilus septentrionalis TaxID=329112 RepID=UPI00247A9ED9|nr:uncharacterized protein LOC129773425 [Toxorhynchites rutilus septentrionalis]
MTVHTDSIATVRSRLKPMDEIAIIGDFNLPGIKWRPSRSGFLYPDANHSTLSTCTVSLLDSYSISLLQQINHVENNNGRILDLCFVSSADSAPVISAAAAPLVTTVSYHPALHLVLENRASNQFRKTATAVYYDFKEADYNAISNVLSTIDWEDVLDCDDVDNAVQMFSIIVNYAIDRHVPKRTTLEHSHTPWQTRELSQMKTAKRAALRRFAKYRTVPLRNYYVRLNNVYKRTTQSCYRSYITNMQLKLKSNPKSFWKFVNEQRNESGLPSTMEYNGRWSSDTQTICDLFADKFGSVFSDESITPAQIESAAGNVPFLGQSCSHIEVDEPMVQSAMNKLKASCSVGPDGIPSIILKKCAANLMIPLCRIFRLSLISGTFPTSWKSAFLIPVHKKTGG